jgi:hypothetical protein
MFTARLLQGAALGPLFVPGMGNAWEKHKNLWTMASHAGSAWMRDAGRVVRRMIERGWDGRLLQSGRGNPPPGDAKLGMRAGCQQREHAETQDQGWYSHRFFSRSMRQRAVFASTSASLQGDERRDWFSDRQARARPPPGLTPGQ